MNKCCLKWKKCVMKRANLLYQMLHNLHTFLFCHFAKYFWGLSECYCYLMAIIEKSLWRLNVHTVYAKLASTANDADDEIAQNNCRLVVINCRPQYTYRRNHSCHQKPKLKSKPHLRIKTMCNPVSRGRQQGYKTSTLQRMLWETKGTLNHSCLHYSAWRKKEIERSSDWTAQILTTYQQKQKKTTQKQSFFWAVWFWGQADVTQQITRSEAAVGRSDDFSLGQLSQ